jgi:Tfp pilus assembly protein PilW
MSPIRPQAGLSMIELMVALIIGVIITFGVVNLFLQIRVSLQQDDQIARLQENGRWALRYLSRELTMTGFYGNSLSGDGLTTALVVANDCDTGWALDASEPVEHLADVTDLEATAAYGCLATGEVAVGTDILAIRRAKDSPHMEDGTASTALEDNTVYLRLEQFGSSGSLVRGSDFTTGDKTAGSSVDAWEYIAQLLYVRNYADTPGDGVPSLCVKRLSDDAATIAVEATECLVEGVENFQIEFGLDQTEPPDYAADFYTATPTAAQLGQAVNARIYVLARSLDEVPGYTNDKSYALGSTTQAASNDGYYRRLMQTTVVLRNGEVFGF